MQRSPTLPGSRLTDQSTHASGSPPALELQLFGPFQAATHGKPLERLGLRKEMWLLALLALRSPAALDRTWIAETLWPDSDRSLGLQYVRRSLVAIRSALGTESRRLVSPGAGTIAIDVSDADVDVVSFRRCIVRADPDSVAKAISLYRGPLLEGCDEEWVLLDRRRYESDFLTAAQVCAEAAFARGDWMTAIAIASAALEIDPLHEPLARLLMVAHAASGNIAATQREYRALRTRLRSELNTVPCDETIAVYESSTRSAALARGAPRAQPTGATRHPDAPPRHRSTPEPYAAHLAELSTSGTPSESVLERSYEQLPELDRRLLTSLAAFVDGIGPQAADVLWRRICKAARVEPPIGSLFERLIGLVERSLLSYEQTADGSVRYRLDPLVRRFALSKSVGGAGEHEARTTLCSWVVDLVGEAKAGLLGPRQQTWLTTLTAERTNIADALTALCEEGDCSQALRAAIDLKRFWRTHGHAAEGRALLQKLVASLRLSEDDPVLADALSCEAELACALGDYDQADALGAEALTIYRSVGDSLSECSLLIELGGCAVSRGRFEQARDLFEQARPLAEHKRQQAAICAHLGYIERVTGDPRRAADLLTDAVRLYEQIGDVLEVASNLGSLAHVVRIEGRPSEASSLLTRTLDAYRSLGHLPGQAWALASLAELQAEMGELADAKRSIDEAVAVNQETGSEAGEAWSLRVAGTLAFRMGDPDNARSQLTRSLEIDRRIGALDGAAWTRLCLARAHSAAGHHAEARADFAAALTAMSDLGVREGVSAALVGICEFLGSVGEANASHAIERIIRDDEPGETDRMADATVAALRALTARIPRTQQSDASR